ncbi:hypothetical protein HLB44_31395 [Aquincola sp. S2]|uniref:Uncharacterized protein n=1 Tax=Pseudaquabacterium terrae TaxID=2732868 RepID=A0ABX2ES86_9BURK|nr:hypothetical protein [Aquabacterium terrae]NRF71502.1 hypothetical protein [Aquabacterium terrae]
MQSSKFSLLSSRARLAGAAFGLVSGLSVFAVVVGAFASASGELEPALAKLKAAPSASAAVAKAASRPRPG